MTGESKSYKWTQMSKKTCPDCGRPIKAKIADNTKGIPLCYVCFKISKGKKQVHKYKVENGALVKPLTKEKTIDLLKVREENRKKYGWYEKQNSK